jgi:hypothetical protein
MATINKHDTVTSTIKQPLPNTPASLMRNRKPVPVRIDTSLASISIKRPSDSPASSGPSKLQRLNSALTGELENSATEFHSRFELLSPRDLFSSKELGKVAGQVIDCAKFPNSSENGRFEPLTSSNSGGDPRAARVRELPLPRNFTSSDASPQDIMKFKPMSPLDRFSNRLSSNLRERQPISSQATNTVHLSDHARRSNDQCLRERQHLSNDISRSRQTTQNHSHAQQRFAGTSFPTDKAAFLAPFSQIYDTHTRIYALESHLNNLARKARNVLHVLEGSGI